MQEYKNGDISEHAFRETWKSCIMCKYKQREEKHYQNGDKLQSDHILPNSSPKVPILLLSEANNSQLTCYVNITIFN